MTMPEVASALPISKNLFCPKNSASSSSLAAAVAFLKEKLIEGPLDASVIWKAAREQGLSVITVKRAKVKAGVITSRANSIPKPGPIEPQIILSFFISIVPLIDVFFLFLTYSAENDALKFL